MTNGLWILEDHVPVMLTHGDLLIWADWMGRFGNRIVKQEEVGKLRVSTVFLGLDHNFAMEGEPILFETMIFGSGDGRGDYMERCATWNEALLMHERAVTWAMAKTGAQTGVDAKGIA
jgi:hypothetical protein